MNKRVLAIVQDVRKRCEDFAFSRKAKDYPFYKEANLDCMCAVASFVLHTALRRNGFKSRVAYGFFDRDSNHCWVELNKYIIDITASQFELKPIYITHKDNDLYAKKRSFIRYSRFFHNWGGQKPSSRISRSILSQNVLTPTE